MKPIDALRLAREKLVEHGLHDWQATLCLDRRTCGWCVYREKTIKLSIHHVTINSREYVLDTILHEIAHALVGPGNGHNAVWKEQAAKLGAIPRACASPDTVVLERQTFYLGTCERCGEVLERRRGKPRLKRSHRGCGGEVIYEPHHDHDAARRNRQRRAKGLRFD